MAVRINNPVGISEIAELADVTPQAVNNWVTRHDDFPTPKFRIKAGAVWEAAAVEKWLANRGIRPNHNPRRAA